jgi:hypothetical protein
MTLGSHQRTIGLSQVHVTPKWIIDATGPYDLDPCAADPRPWPCARTNWTTHGLDRPWPHECFVFLNPTATKASGTPAGAQPVTPPTAKEVTGDEIQF